MGVQRLHWLGWASTGVRDDYVMAGVYTRIYMALMYSDTFSVCVALSVYRTTAWPCLPCSFKHAPWRDIDSMKIGTAVGELQTGHFA